MGSFSDLFSALTPVRRGDPVEKVASSARINAIQELLLMLARGDNIKLGRGMRKGATIGSITIHGSESRGGRGGGSYRVWNYSTESERGQFSITFRDGLVSNILPTNIGEKIALKRGKNYIFAVAKASGAVIDQVAMVVDSNLKRGRLVEAKGAPPSEVPVLIALAVVADDGVNVTRLRFRNVICTSKETRRDSRKPPGPGEEAFIRYFAWSVSDPDL
jgi:hypothetical protein